MPTMQHRRQRTKEKKLIDLNLTIVAGRLAAKPEVRIFEGGGTLMRMLVTTRTEEPRRRIDVVPVVMWDADMDEFGDLERGDRVWISGAIQRRFWSDDNSRRSRIEVVAKHVERLDKTTEEDEG